MSKTQRNGKAVLLASVTEYAESVSHSFLLRNDWNLRLL